MLNAEIADVHLLCQQLLYRVFLGEFQRIIPLNRGGFYVHNIEVPLPIYF